jgi:demethylphylloquinone reductase
MVENKRRICIIGGGFGGLFTALNLADAGRVTLISREDHFLFTPMLYEYLSGEVEAWQIAPRYEELIGDETKFLRGEVTGIDFGEHEIAIAAQKGRVGYDILIIAVGSVTNYESVEGAEQYALPFRQLRHADDLRRRLTKALDHVPPDSAPKDVREALAAAVVGGDASGIELSTKIADLLRAAFERRGLRGEPRVIIVEESEQIGRGMSDDLRTSVEEALDKSRVEVQTQTKVVRVTAKGLQIEHDKKSREIGTAAVVWAGGVKVNPLVEKLGLEREEKGLLAVEQTLQVRGHENVFALGDIAHYANADQGMGGTAQLAYQEAGLVAANVRALLEGQPLKTKHFEELGEAMSLGTQSAAVEVDGHVVDGALGREARFAMYAARLPTWHQRFRVAPRWILGGSDPRPL